MKTGRKTKQAQKFIEAATEQGEDLDESIFRRVVKAIAKTPRPESEKPEGKGATEDE